MVDKTMKNTISACLVIYNEEKVLERCLGSLVGVVDEIIVVHDGECTDKSIEIAKKYTEKIFIKEHAGIMEAHAVFALDQATSEWILRIDADEFLSADLRDNLRQLIKNENVDGYEFIWPCWNGEHYITKNWPYKGILFRKSKLHYIGFPHEQIKSYGLIEKRKFILDHMPKYNNYTYDSFKNKWLKWARIQANYFVDKKFDQLPKFNVIETDWSPKLKWSINHSYLFPLIGIYVCFLNIIQGSWREGIFGLKSSIMWGFYNGFLYYFVWRNRKIVTSKIRFS